MTVRRVCVCDALSQIFAGRGIGLKATFVAAGSLTLFTSHGLHPYTDTDYGTATKDGVFCLLAFLPSSSNPVNALEQINPSSRKAMVPVPSSSYVGSAISIGGNVLIAFALK